jgi:hypothetical protein
MCSPGQHGDLLAQPDGPGHTHAVDPISEDAIFEAIRAAVDAGEYTNWLPAAQARHGAAARGPAPNAPEGGYLRGSPEHLQARALGLVARLPRPRWPPPTPSRR